MKSDASLIKYVIIVAGGSGLRAGGDIPKQFQMLCGKPMLWWSMKHFAEEDSDVRIILVLNESYLELWEKQFSNLSYEDKIKHIRVKGGETRFHSVLNGLNVIEEKGKENIFVAVHDAARPLALPDMIRRGWQMAISNRKSVVPVIAPRESLRKIDSSSENLSHAVNRSQFLSVQTPQIFPLDVLLKAYETEFKSEFTDDASVVESNGEKVFHFEGDSKNFKVTNPEDFALATYLLKGVNKDEQLS